MVDATDTFSLAPDLIHRAVGGEVFVLTADSRVHWLKNDSAITIWTALERAGAAGVTREALVNTIVAEFEVTPEAAAADVAAFVRTLADEGLVRVSSTSSGAPGPH